jgi:alpha-L-fucosidase
MKMMGKISKLGLFVMLVATAAPLFAAVTTSKPEDIEKLIPQETPEQYQSRIAWWQEARFGMFIHFGLYAMPARHEWVKYREYLDDAHYERYFKRFNPDLFDAKQWARQAKQAGMRYAILTAKHHEGFCMFDTKYSDYKITNTPFKRDLVREFVDAFRAEGIRVGFYYSLLDWHHKDFTIDRCHPQRNLSKEKIAQLNAGRDMAKYRKYMKDQITELMTQYGKIDIVWYDFSYPGKNGKGRDDWDSAGIVTLTRKLQPGIIIDNRLDLNDFKGGVDFVTPEQVRVTMQPTFNGVPYAWEACHTLSGSWGYHRDEASWKGAVQCLDLLIGCVAYNGNLIMNVGPTARGIFDARASERLDDYAKWMRVNSRSIYGCGAAPKEFKTPEGTHLTYNRKTNRLYVHLLNYPFKTLILDFGSKIDYAQFLHDGSELQIRKMSEWECSHLGISSADRPVVVELPVVKPDVLVPVVELYLK